MALKWMLSRKQEEGALEADLPMAKSVQPAPAVDTSQGWRTRLPRFRGPTMDQSRVARGSDVEAVRLRLRQAFTPSQPVVDPDMLAGRSDVMATLIRAVEDMQMHTVLYGDRGIGKTSILHVTARIAREARYIVRYSSCGEETEIDPLFREILREIPLLYHSDFSPTSTEVELGGSFADLLPEGPVTVPFLSDLLAKVSNTRVLLILDEFDRARSQNFHRGIAEIIKNLSDRSVKVQFLIAGVATNMTELIGHVPSIRRNITAILVPNMRRAEVEELIARGSRQAGISFDEEAVELVATAAHGSPYISGLLCQDAGYRALDRNDVKVGKADVAAAINRALNELRLRISPRSRQQIGLALSDFDTTSLGVLARVALRGNGRVLPVNVARMLKVDEADLALAFRLLVDKYELLTAAPDDAGGAFNFVEEGVPIYLWLSLAQSLLSTTGVLNPRSANFLGGNFGRWPSV